VTGNLKALASRVDGNRRVLRPPGDPHRWWRTRDADSYRNADLELLDRALADGPAFLDPDWPAASRGDAAAAVRIAMKAINKSLGSRRSTDVPMTAVLRNAVRADHASRLVLCHALKRLAQRHPSYWPVAASWIQHELDQYRRDN
jgi:hypothetical protein